MGMRWQVGLLPRLLPGEKVLYSKRWVWAWSCKSLPTYRVMPNFPLLSESGLYVTDRRALHVFHLFRLVTCEFSQWFEGKSEPRDADCIKEVRVGRNPLLGPYLEIVSEDPQRRWWRSHRCRFRISLRHPERAHQVISEAMAGSHGSS